MTGFMRRRSPKKPWVLEIRPRRQELELVQEDELLCLIDRRARELFHRFGVVAPAGVAGGGRGHDAQAAGGGPAVDDGQPPSRVARRLPGRRRREVAGVVRPHAEVEHVPVAADALT